MKAMSDIVEKLKAKNTAYVNATGLSMPELEEARDEITRLRAINAELVEALTPFARYRGEERCDPLSKQPVEPGILYERGTDGNYCLPDGHGFEMVWADENDGGTIDFTAGQFRRANAALAKARGETS